MCSMDMNLADILNETDTGTLAPTQPLALEIVGELSLDEMAQLDEKSKVQTTIQKLRARHHHLAKLMAEGTPYKQAAVITGYALATVRALATNTAFRELVVMYKAQVDQVHLTTSEKIAALSSDAADELAARLEDDPDKFSHKMLLELLKTTSDRSGNGPTSTTNTNVNIGIAERLQSARERVQLIDITPEEK